LYFPTAADSHHGAEVAGGSATTTALELPMEADSHHGA
jgi:hypothetical protein